MRRFVQALAALALTAVSGWSQVTAELASTKPVGRGESISLVVQKAPDGFKASGIKLDPISGGEPVPAANVESKSDAADKTRVTVSGQVPDGAPFGSYRASVSFTTSKGNDNTATGASGVLSIQPASGGGLHLTDFTPPNTYDWEEVWIPDPNNSTTETVDTKHVTLAVSADKKASIRIDGQPAQVSWTGCDNVPASSEAAPLPELKVFGRADDKSIELCRVPADSRITVDGDPSILAVSAGKNDPVWKSKYGGRQVRTTDLTLHGTGFASNAKDNVVWLNRVAVPIIWDTCSVKLAAGSSTDPVTLQTHGEVIGPEEIRLCRVRVPDDGQMRVAVGFGGVPSETRVFRVFSMSKAAVAWRAALAAAALALLPLGLLSFAKRAYSIGSQPYKLRMLFLDPETDTYSLSKFQFYLWTVACIFAYVYLFIAFVKVQNLPWPDVPATLPGIIAVAAGTTVGSQLVSSNKGSKGAGDQQPSFSDFITSGGVVAPDRLQMFLWTLIGVGAFFIAVLEQGPGTISGLPAVPERLLYLMGISSAGYLGGKMARAAGPVINEISITPAESDASLAKRAGPVTVLPDLVEAVTEAQGAMGNFPGVTNPNATNAINALSDAVKAAKAAQTVTEWNQLIDTLRALKGNAEQAARDTASDFTAKKAVQAEAETAQKAASTLQDFAANVTQALSTASASAMQSVESPPLIPRTIVLRGTNMASEGLFEIDHADLPFRMLLNKDGQNAPDAVIREDTNPKFARLLRLTIDPARLGTSDLEQFQKWFSGDGPHTFTLTNLDGQKAELGFKVPPGETQKVGS